MARKTDQSQHAYYLRDVIKSVTQTSPYVLLFSIRTSNIQRTVDSARCVVAGMFTKEGIKGAFFLNFYIKHRSCLETLIFPCRIIKILWVPENCW